MIKVQDWIASIPDEEKHIAYVGEGKSEQREFLLCGNGWEQFSNFNFHLDMAFDPTSITTRDSRQVVQTTHNSTENKEEATVTVDEVTTKETYTVENVQVTNNYLTDVAPLVREVTADGIRLTWDILRQHTVLPGKLWATIRAVDGEAQRIKKSAIMVFEVDPSVAATPAAMPPVSEMEQIEMRINKLCQFTQLAADEAEEHAATATSAADTAIRSATTATIAADSVLGNMRKAVDAANAAEQNATITAQQAQTAATHAASAAIAAEGAYNHGQTALNAVTHCSRYTQRCEEYAAEATQAVKHLKYNRVNVLDYGAVGDGIADDRAAIVKAFNAAKTQLPCEVYFPAGTYGIISGITIEMEYGTGGLHVCGAGRDVTTIKYLDDYTSQKGWYAIRIWPVGRPDTIPDEDDYLHDISYTGLTVYDPDPIGHALNEKKGDPATEETHGFDIHCCKGVSVTDCQFITVGDEAIDICFCHDVVVMNNRLIGSPGAGASGGAIAIGDGCKGVVVSGNTINGSAPDEVLADGTVLTKSNAGIVVETPSGYPVQDVIIIGNSIRNVHGKGVILSAETAGSSLTNAIVADNIISGCDIGVLVSGAQLKDNIKITNNVIADCVGRAIEAVRNIGNISICGNTIRNIQGNYAIYAPTTCHQYIADNVLENIKYGALYCDGDVVLKDCVFNGLGTAETAPSVNTYGVYKISGTITVSGCTFKNVRMAVLKSCLHSVDYIDNTNVEVMSKNTDEVNGEGSAVGGADVKRIVNCSFIGGGIGIQQDNAIVQGTRIVGAHGGDAVTVSANRVSIVGCIIENNSSIASYKAINEAVGYNYNLFANNIVNRGINTKGAQTVAVNNIDTRTTA